MPIVQLQDGTRINFAKTPTPADVDFAFNEIKKRKVTQTPQAEPVADPNDFLKLKSNQDISTIGEGAVDTLATPLKSFINLATSPIRAIKNVVYDIPKETAGVFKDAPDFTSADQAIAEGFSETANDLVVKPLRGIGNAVLGAFQELVQKTTGVDIGDTEAKKAINTLAEHLINNKLEDATTVVAGVKKLVTENPEQLVPILMGMNTTLSKVKGEPVDIVSSTANTTKIPQAVDTTVAGTKKVVGKIKDTVSPPTVVDDVVGRIAQGKTTDIPAVKRTLQNIDTEGTKSYADLQTKLKKEIKPLAEQVDAELSKDTKVRKLKELSLAENTESGQVVKTNYVKEALNNLSELYTKTGDNVAKVEIRDLMRKANGKGLTYKEVNDISRKYGNEFSSKAFSKVSGDPLTSVNAQKFENVRSGLKSTARQGLGGEEAQALDAKLSDLYDTEKLIGKQVEKVNTAKQKKPDTNIYQKATTMAINVADYATGNPLKAVARKLGTTPEAINALEIEGNLPKNLKILKEEFAKEKALAEATKVIPESVAEVNTPDGIANFIKENDGITVDSKGNMPTTGYSVAPSKSTEVKIPVSEFTPESIVDYKKKFAKELSKPDAHFGAWKDGENFVLDVFYVVSDLKKALDIAKKGKQDGIFNLDTFKTIFTKDVMTPPKGRGAGVLNKELKASKDQMNGN